MVTERFGRSVTGSLRWVLPFGGGLALSIDERYA
jgi:hypothetical protein